jgi:hypothetical protein
MINWLIYGIPAEVQIIILLLVAAGVLYVLGRILGWERVRGWVLPVAGVISALGLASKLRQQGYSDRRAEEEKALDRAEEIHGEIEDKVENLPDNELADETDRWSRK